MGFYINSRNEDFSQLPSTAGILLGSFTKNFSNGEYNRFKSILSNPLTYASSLQEGRDAEGFVFINGRRIPGIFQGFEINGGINVEKFDKDKMEIKPIKTSKVKTGGNEIVQVYQVNRGTKPITGRADFTFLDDNFSTAVQKAKEFVRIVTRWQGGEASEDLMSMLGSDKPIEKVFKIRSLLIGKGRPFNINYVMIPDFKCNMGTGIEGKIDGSFNFEQFNLFLTEKEPENPKSKQKGAGGGREKAKIEEPSNPVAVPIIAP